MNDPEDWGTAATEGDVVQVSPRSRDRSRRGCMVVVTDVRPWGVQGYVQDVGLNDKPGPISFCRVEWADFEHIGKARWRVSV